MRRIRWAMRRHGRHSRPTDNVELMKAGRVIGGDEHEARAAAQKLVDDAKALAANIVGDARVEAERVRAASDSVAAAPAQPAEGTVDEVVGLIVRATVPGV